jgi:hypothetical protein
MDARRNEGRTPLVGGAPFVEDGMVLEKRRSGAQGRPTFLLWQTMGGATTQRAATAMNLVTAG